MTVTYDAQGGVALITMDDGKANAVSPTLLRELHAAFDRAEAEQHVVVLAGRAGKFCAGFDLSVVQSGPDAAQELMAGGANLARRMLTFPTPIVLACTGHCLAMGALLALSADYRIGAEGSFKIGLNEVAIKMTMPYFGVELAKARLARPYQIPTVACSMLLAPHEAVQAGFLDRVVAPDQVVPEAMAFAGQLTAIDYAAHHATKLRMRADLLAALDSREPGM